MQRSCITIQHARNIVKFTVRLSEDTTKQMSA